MITDNLQTWFSSLAKTVWFDVDTRHTSTQSWRLNFTTDLLDVNPDGNW